MQTVEEFIQLAAQVLTEAEDLRSTLYDVDYGMPRDAERDDRQNERGEASRTKVVDVTLNYDAGDNCGVSCVLSIEGPDRSGSSATWTIVDSRRVRFAFTDEGKWREETYTIKVTCTDAAGNRAVKQTTVIVPDRR